MMDGSAGSARRWTARMSLRWQLTLTFLLASTLVLGVLGMIGYQREAGQLEAELERAITAAELRLDQALPGPVWDYDLELVQALLQAEMTSNPHLAELGLWLDTDRGYAYGRGSDWAVVPIDLGAITEPTRSWQLVHNGQAIGRVDLTATRRWVTQSQGQRTREILITILAMSGLLVALVAVLLHRMLLRRLGGIAQAIEAAPDVEVGAGDEVAVLVSGAGALLARLTEILDAIQDAVIVVDGELRVRRTNPAAAELLGRGQTELHGAHLPSVLPLVIEGRDASQALRREVLEAGGIMRVAGTLPLRRSDGALRHVALVASPAAVGGAGARGMILSLHDLTHLVRVEEQLRQGQKLESIGQLAGGVAHDFNNMLGAVTGAAELIKLAGDDGAKRDEYADMILRVARQAADLNAKLLAFSRKGPVQQTLLQVDDMVEQACTMLHHGLDRRIELSVEPPADALRVRGDAAALVNCLLNLGINARDAMPDGGLLRIAWRPVELDDAECRELGEGLAPGSYVQIQVSDTGKGIPPHLVGSIFDPFFTTKPQGRGTGLGLSATYGTVISHDGHISVDSTEGQGSVFTILLPLSAEDGAAAASGPTHQVIGAGGRVLIIDDDDGVREVARALLESRGFEPVCATCGEDGIARFAEDPGGYLAVLLDLIMPDLSGKETFERLRQLRADVPVILVSGYNASIDIDELLAAGARSLLTKPFRSADLMRALAPLMAPDGPGSDGSARTAPG